MSKTIRLYGKHYFIMKIPKKRELQQTVSNNCPILSLRFHEALQRLF